MSTFSASRGIIAVPFCIRMNWRRSAIAPETWGVAMDVPLKVLRPEEWQKVQVLLGTVEVIAWPGASRSKKLARFVNEEIASTVVLELPSSVLPTEVAFWRHAGAAIVLVLPELPLAATTEIFFPTAESTAALKALSLESQ